MRENQQHKSQAYVEHDTNSLKSTLTKEWMNAVAVAVAVAHLSQY